MFIGLGTVSAAPFILGILMAAGVVALLYRIKRFEFGKLSMSLLIWYSLYSIHGGSTEGGMAVMIAALILDVIILPLFFWRKKHE